MKEMKQLHKMLAAMLASVMMLVQLGSSAVYATSDTGEEEVIDGVYCYEEGYNVSVEIGAEGSVLLKNDDLLPLEEGAKVTILGSMSYNYVEGGTGSAGGKDDENTVLMMDAFVEAGLDVNQDAWYWLEETCGGARGVDEADPAGVGWDQYEKIHEFGIDVYESNQSTILKDGYTDYAVVTISRSGAEGASPSMDYDGDGSTLTGTTYLELNDDEKDLLAFAAENFGHTIVLINSAAQMELGFIDSEAYNIDACLWIGHPGEAGIVGTGTILTGRTNPSGRLVDTYGYDMTTNPTYYNTDDNAYTSGQTFYQYEEGIYVGYRYYETADAVGYFDSESFSGLSFKNGSVSGYDQVVQFPFGYGLSYSTFEQEIADSKVDLNAHETNSITVKVTNTGDVAGKEVVQLYMEAPYQSDTENFGIKGVGLEKSKVVLIGFAKTGELAPGASEEVTIDFDTDALASFDNFGQGCYVLEEGTYSFNIQADAHHWGASDADNAVSDQVTAKLDASIIYDESGDVAGAEYAGARSSDEIIAKNAMDDVTAGDGNMLEGYLSRNDIAGGMASIMSHTSNEEANEVLDSDVQACLDLTNTDTYDYTFETYIKGVKTSITETIYAHGANVMPFSEVLPDGTSTDSFGEQLWGQTYYVLEDENGEALINDQGVPTVVDSEPTDGSGYHVLSVDDMSGVDIKTEAGLAVWDQLTNMVTLDEAIEIQGNSGWNVSAIESVGKPAQKCQDGPGEPANGQYAGATWFPCAVTIAATWNTDLANAQGISYGHQATLAGVGGAYAPAMNMHRSPFGGRNFEYYSEDGFISGHIGGNVVAGIQSTGTNVFIKHFALNDGDTNRGGNTTWANEQAIREIYLPTYEISCKEYGADGIMGSLNRIGMTWYHYGMYVTVLRDEWGWDGFLITDGDGGAGDAYNNPQMMLVNQGAMLTISNYINGSATEAAYGDAMASNFGQYSMHEMVRSTLYQYAGSEVIGVTSGEATDTGVNVIPIIIGAGVAIVVIIGGVIIVSVNKKKKKAAGARA